MSLSPIPWDPSAERLRPEDLTSLTLAKGGHEDRTDGVCLLEAVAWFAGETHTDRPECVCPILAAFGRSWNDSLNDEDRQMLRPYIAKFVGTKATPEIEERRGWMCTDWLARTCAVEFLRIGGFADHADTLAALPELVDSATAGLAQPSLNAAGNAALNAARNATRNAAGNAAGNAALNAARNATRNAAWNAALNAARNATRNAAWNAAGNAAGNAAWNAARNAAGNAAGNALAPTVKVLQLSALGLLDRMIALSPGVEVSQ